MMIKPGKTYQEVYDSFKWNIPEFYNIADDVCDRWAGDASRIALVYEDENKKIQRFSYAAVQCSATPTSSPMCWLASAFNAATA